MGEFRIRLCLRGLTRTSTSTVKNGLHTFALATTGGQRRSSRFGNHPCGCVLREKQMTNWIGTNQVGWDPNSIGFHSVNGCTGLVVCTDHWVAGWHVGGGAGGNYLLSGLSKTSFQGAAFLTYIQQINPNPWPIGALPAGNVSLWNIHLGQTDWSTTLQDFATLLGYHGQAHGRDLSPKVGTDSCDMMITRTVGPCQINYKRTSKMNHVKQTDQQRDLSVVKTIRGSPSDPVRTQDLWNNESASASVKSTFSNNGQMHIAATKMFVQTNV